MKTFYWDFYGPRARGTAEHFAKHLEEFLQKHGLENCETGTESTEPNHRAAWCKAPPAAEETIEKALKPRRFGESESLR